MNIGHQIKKQHEIDTFFKAVAEENQPTVEKLITNGLSVDVRNPIDNSTPLMSACEKGFGSMVTCLLHFKADPNTTNGDGETPLHRTFSSLPQIIVVARLLRGGALVDTKDNKGQTVFLYGVQRCIALSSTKEFQPEFGYSNSLIQLLVSGADPLTPDHSGITAVDKILEHVKCNKNTLFSAELLECLKPHIDKLHLLEKLQDIQQLKKFAPTKTHKL